MTPPPRPLPPASPLAWSAAQRLALAAGLSALLWVAVGWALGWW